jgi:hypothetical protein
MFVELKKPFLGRAAGERIDVSEADARQLVQQGTAVAVADDLIGPAVTRALDAALARAGQNIDAAVNQSLKAFADAQSLARKHAAPALFGPGGNGDPHGKTFGDWCLAVARGDRHYTLRGQHWHGIKELEVVRQEGIHVCFVCAA